MSAEPRGVTHRKGCYIHMGKCGSNQIWTCKVPRGGTMADNSETADNERKGPGIERNAAGRGSNIEWSMYHEYKCKMSGSLYNVLAHFQGLLERRYSNDDDKENSYSFVSKDSSILPLTPFMRKEWVQYCVRAAYKFS
jgi:hypothetical protein